MSQSNLAYGDEQNSDPQDAQSNWPVSITLRFKSQAAKDYFLGQLSDGWGENEVDLEWGDDKNTPLTHAIKEIRVTVYEYGTWNEVIEAKPKRGKRGVHRG